ncbi:hypothetical protein [Chryseobacterium indologenes]|uniref:Uncharacterized protein n=1 Tax=Chryseobacterium indologenes TaxID=253 RepID=A0A0N0ZUI2_CHRID|nr:hypothetical protein [Chryseobacterium indologenes]KPE50107.1 hypothetical protein AOB46_16850 [Chryseobacterium indologenes]
MDKILKFPIIPQSVYERYRAIKRRPVTDSDSMSSLLGNILRDSLSDNNEASTLAKLILFDLKNYLNHPAIYKEKYTANALETRLALLGDGRTSDDLPKTNPTINILLEEEKIQKIPSEIFTKICSNFREKGDLIFYNPRINSSYKISIKSLVPENNEINFGAFDFTSLVQNILDPAFLALGERRSKLTILSEETQTEFEIGRGSKAQLQQLFNYVNSIGKLDEFIERWEIVFEGVFKEDIIIYIKDYNKCRMYLLTNADFKRCISDSLRNHWHEFSKSAINRWEGNSIRMDKNVILRYCSFEIDQEFSDFFDESTIVAKFNELENIKATQLVRLGL